MINISIETEFGSVETFLKSMSDAVIQKRKESQMQIDSEDSQLEMVSLRDIAAYIYIQRYEELL